MFGNLQNTKIALFIFKNALTLSMFPRLLEKDVRVALQKLEKLPVNQIRKVSKDVGGTKESGSEKTKCEKCEQILAKLFTVQDNRPVNYATSAKNEEEKLEQKLETIEERPLAEAESSGHGLEFPPKVLGRSLLRPSDTQWRRQYIEDVAFDEIARRLMSTPPQEIDRRLLEAYSSSTSGSLHTEKGELELMPEINRETEVSTTKLNVDEVLFDGVIESTFPSSRQVYSVDPVNEADNPTWVAERPTPTHYDAEYANYIEKGTLRHKVLRDMEDLGAALVPQNELMLVPLPPNLTSISSFENPQPNLNVKEVYDSTESTSISFHTLPRNIERYSHESSKGTAEFVSYCAAPVSSTTTNKTAPIVKKEDIDRIPLSTLLKWARQRSKMEKETLKNQALKGARYLGKAGTCLPPLDKRPRAKTCPPRPCTPKRKEPPCTPRDPCSAPKQMPCPPAKKVTCPPQKMPCPCPPPTKMPCPPPSKPPCPPASRPPCPPPSKPPCPPPKDPCPSSPCDPCKTPPPCPPRQKPCGLIIGNRIKETISLILGTYESFSSFKLLSNTKGRCSMSTVAFHQPLLDDSPLLELRRSGDHPCSELSLVLESEELQSVVLARSFDPWTPIPSWPIPKKVAQKRLICPKEGCPPPKPPRNPCKEQPCDTAKHRKFTVVNNINC